MISDKLDVNNIPFDDKDVYDLISEGFVLGIFHLETPTGKMWAARKN